MEIITTIKKTFERNLDIKKGLDLKKAVLHEVTCNVCSSSCGIGTVYKNDKINIYEMEVNDNKLIVLVQDRNVSVLEI